MQQYFIANWKQHKTAQETRDFLSVFKDQIDVSQLGEKQIIICPSFTSLQAAQEIVKEHGIDVSLGAQDVSEFDDGAYTGEVGGSQIKEFADFVIIGHSERRRYFGETPEQVAKKVANAKKAGLTVVLCVQDENEPVVEGADLVAFEPVGAIGTGQAEDPAEVSRVFELLKAKINVPLIYGGSVDANGIVNYKSVPNIAGFLIGGASLEPESFSNIIKAW